jgi:hypothetical protein
MQKGLGIAALILGILAIFTPFLGTWLTIVVAVMAAFAYGPGLALGIAAIAVNVIHIFFFSPLLWATQAVFSATEASGAGDMPFLPWILIAFQVGAAVVLFMLNKKHKLAPARA